MKPAETTRATEATQAVTTKAVELARARRDPHRVSGAPDPIVASASKTPSMGQGSEMRVDRLKIKKERELAHKPDRDLSESGRKQRRRIQTNTPANAAEGDR